MDNKHALYSAMRFNFLYVDRYVFRTGWIYPENFVPYSIVRYIVRGEALFKIDGQEIQVHENQIIYIPEGCRMECRTYSEHFEFISIRFNVTSKLENADLLSEYYHLQVVNDYDNDPEIYRYFREVYRSATSEDSGKMFRVRGYLELIIAWLADHSTKSCIEEKEPVEESKLNVGYFQHREIVTSQIKRDPRIQVVVNYMITHPAEKFTTEQLSDMAHMSPSSLRRLFKQTTGKSPGDFIKEIRMATAARMLLVSDERISTIAYTVGFDDPNYFARKFKERFGVSPQAYRQNAQG